MVSGDLSRFDDRDLAEPSGVARGASFLLGRAGIACPTRGARDRHCTATEALVERGASRVLAHTSRYQQ